MALKVFLFCFFFFVSFSGAFSAEEKALAYLDGKPITYSDIKSYVERLPGNKYEEMLKSKEGLKQLVKFYIDRKILLEEAKKSVLPDEGVIRSHRGMEEDSAYIIAYLAKEVGKKVMLNEEEVEKYAKEKNLDIEKAYRELLSLKRREQFRKLLEKLKKKHKIDILVK